LIARNKLFVDCFCGYLFFLKILLGFADIFGNNSFATPIGIIIITINEVISWDLD